MIKTRNILFFVYLKRKTLHICTIRKSIDVKWDTNGTVFIVSNNRKRQVVKFVKSLKARQNKKQIFQQDTY